MGGDERVIEAHRAAVTTALDELEKYTHARIGGNAPAEATGRFIAAKFEHDTARPVDGYAAPQLHTHAIIFNVTERADGSTRAIQERAFFESQNYATAVYQSTLTHQLRKLGYEIEAGKSGAPEIKGYSQEYLDASSPRSQQIKEQLEKTGHSGPEAAQIAAHKTRNRKQTLTQDEVLSAHKAMAADFDNQPQQVIASARHRAEYQHPVPAERDGTKEAVSFAKLRAFEREAVADERLILRDALRRGMGEVTLGEIQAEFNERRQAGEFRSVQGEKYSSGRSFTTPQMIAHERANVQHVLDGQGKAKPFLSGEKAERQAGNREFLNESQKTAIVQVLTSGDRVQGLQGMAGTGKTTVLESIRKGAEEGGYRVEGFAPTSRAAGQLREAGIEAGTLQSFLMRKDQNEPEKKREPRLYMLDESSLASSVQMRSFLEKTKPEDRVLVIGDTRQHQGVDAGRPFEQMQEAGMQTAKLDRIMRQKDPELLKAVQHLAQNETEKGIAMLGQQGRVTQIPSALDRVAAIAKDYVADPANTVIVSPDNKSRQQINEAVRGEMLKNGMLSDNVRAFQTLSQRSDMTGADRTWAGLYKEGDIVQYTRGSQEEGIKKGNFGVIRSADQSANRLTVELQDGSSVNYDPRRLYGVNVYQERTREFATGDRLQFSGLNKKLEIANRDMGTITGIHKNEITVLMDGKKPRSITLDTNEFRQFDHGYAVTSHSSQGLTATRVLANMDTESARSLINTRLAYVAISRASEDARIYTNDAETLGARLATDVTKSVAVDFRPPAARMQAASSMEVPAQRRVYEYASPDHRLAAVAQDYASRPEKTIVLAPDQAERRELTDLIRADLYAQGKLSSKARALPVLVEKELANPKLAANYSPGDRIHYRTGSPSIEGIMNNSEATVLANDAKRNILTIETDDRTTVSYNPIHLKQQTRESKVYTEDVREIAVGERIQLSVPDKDRDLRRGDLATIEKIGGNNTLTVRMDDGRTVELDQHQARHIEYGYAVNGQRRISADRVIATGETLEAKDLIAVPYKNRDIALYTSDGSIPQARQQEQTPPKQALTPEPQQQIIRTQQHQQDFGLGF